MSAESILSASKIVAFVPTKEPAKARAFYEGVLGLTLVEESPFALVFDAHGTMLRVTVVRELQPAPFTVLGWDVESIDAAVELLAAAGVKFLRYPGVNETDPHAIWTAPSGARIAWFHDPDANVLSLTQF
jgi:catechol 2,3-dioxygenase-like lactoylglutathione lyase family enzyme